MKELTSANTQKAALIQDLVGEVEQKTEQLQQAQSRIEELEQRIADLEIEKAKSMEVCSRGTPHLAVCNGLNERVSHGQIVVTPSCDHGLIF